MRGREAKRGKKVVERVIFLGSYFRSYRDVILLNAAALPMLGEKVFDASMQEIGYVSDVFGPVDSYYVAVKTFEKRSYDKEAKFYILRRG